jgi:hypothetical protein
MRASWLVWSRLGCLFFVRKPGIFLVFFFFWFFLTRSLPFNLYHNQIHATLHVDHFSAKKGRHLGWSWSVFEVAESKRTMLAKPPREYLPGF